jgi:hypothetical protein
VYGTAHRPPRRATVVEIKSDVQKKKKKRKKKFGGGKKRDVRKLTSDCFT